MSFTPVLNPVPVPCFQDLGPDTLFCERQAECDAGGSRILQRYVGFRQFARITKSITQRSGAGDSADGLNLDPREVAALYPVPGLWRRARPIPCAWTPERCPLYTLTLDPR